MTGGRGRVYREDLERIGRSAGADVNFYYRVVAGCHPDAEVRLRYMFLTAELELTCTECGQAAGGRLVIASRTSIS